MNIHFEDGMNEHQFEGALNAFMKTLCTSYVFCSEHLLEAALNISIEAQSEHKVVGYLDTL
jgi:hypothetical protein